MHFSHPHLSEEVLDGEVSTHTASVKLVLLRQSSSLFVNKPHAHCLQRHAARRLLALRVRAHIFCVSLSWSIIMAKVITSLHTFRAFHPPQKACLSFAFSFALHCIFNQPRNRFLGTAASSYQLERKVTRVLVPMYGIACHCKSLTTLRCFKARRKGHLVVHVDVCSSVCVLGGWPQVDRGFFKYLPTMYAGAMIFNVLRFLAQVTFAQRWLLLSGDKNWVRASALIAHWTNYRGSS